MPRDTLILIPGLGCDERLFAHQLGHLGDVCEPVCAAIPDATSVGEMAAAVLADAPARFALAGLSMGGYIAFEIMRRAQARVTRLALLDTKADLDPPEAVEARRAALAEIAAGRFAEHIETRLPALLGPKAMRDAGLKEVTRAMAASVGAERYARQQAAIMARPDSVQGLGAIECPTLVLCGRDDALTPVAKHEAMAAAIAGARLEVVEDAGHLSPLEQPVAVTALIRDWLFRQS